MSKSATDIITKALTLIDEKLTEFEELASTEMSISDMAAEILPDVARDLIKELPYELKRYLATPATLVSEALTGGEDQSNYTKQKLAFTAPVDFWELVSLRLTVWAIPVTEYILIGSPEYARQSNPYTRGGTQHPMVALSNKAATDDLRIECFSIISGDAATVATFEYVSFDNVPDDAGNDWPDEIFDEITKALSSELNIIKGRLQEGSIQGESAVAAIEQHV